MTATIATPPSTHKSAKCEYWEIRALFSQAMYPIERRIRFQIPAQSHVKNKNFGIFIWKTPAGREISCLTAGINLPVKVVILPCFWKNFSAAS